jgi:hypothetical protein
MEPTTTVTFRVTALRTRSSRDGAEPGRWVPAMQMQMQNQAAGDAMAEAIHKRDTILELLRAGEARPRCAGR